MIVTRMAREGYLGNLRDRPPVVRIRAVCIVRSDYGGNGNEHIAVWRGKR